jgi:hypothetical protein
MLDVGSGSQRAEDGVQEIRLPVYQVVGIRTSENQGIE